jgi:hypothetical protein
LTGKKRSNWAKNNFSPWFNQETMIAIPIISTVILTAKMFKVEVGK